MAPVVSAAAPVAVPAKPKRPTPSGVQTNGAHVTSTAKSSPSPSMSTKKPPPAVAKQHQQQQQQPQQQQPQQQQISISAAANGANGDGANRPPNLSRARRDATNQAGGRGQRNSNAGSLRSASLAADSGIPQNFEPRPTGMSDNNGCHEGSVC